MPCYVCNPQCGRCRPPRPRALKCPECGRLTMLEAPAVSDEALRVCRHCGAALPKPEAVACRFAGRECYVPCVRACEEPESGSPEACPWGDEFGR